MACFQQRIYTGAQLAVNQQIAQRFDQSRRRLAFATKLQTQPNLPTRSFSITRLVMSQNTKYPSKEEITKIFKHMETGDFQATFQHVAPDVDWTVMGTHPCAGHYTSLEHFNRDTIQRLGKIMKEPGISLNVRNVIGGGDQEWATIELIAKAECQSGMKFDNTYAWICRFDENHKVVEVRAYLDSWMVKQAIEENEVPSHRAPVPHIN